MTSLGFDLSTQQLKVIAIDAETLKIRYEKAVTFDTDLPHYKTKNGVYLNGDEIYATVSMWLEALDLLLERMKENNFDFGSVRSISGAGQQHGSVYWRASAPTLLENLDPSKNLKEQLSSAFSHDFSPNWQDQSTQSQCDEIENLVDGADKLASLTGSKAHHRFTGPQILKLRIKHVDAYKQTFRISLVSSFLASVFVGKIAPIDISDICGMNLWDMNNNTWSREILDFVSGGNYQRLESLLGEVEHDGGCNLGRICGYYVERYGFSKSAFIIPFTGDNPSTILSLPLRPLDCIISLGTSTTLLMSTPIYKPSPAYHMFNHPTSRGNFMFMLCYKNGALARERVRNNVNAESSVDNASDWSLFDKHVDATKPLGKEEGKSTSKIGIYFPLAEIVPKVSAGTWRFECNDTSLKSALWPTKYDCRAILESQALSMRLRSEPMLRPCEENQHKRQPRRIYVVGGGSKSPAICEVLAQVLGSTEGIFRLDASQACALGSAHKAAWAYGRKTNESFENFVGDWWNENTRCTKVSKGYRTGVWEEYENVLHAFSMAEQKIMMHENN